MRGDGPLDRGAGGRWGGAAGREVRGRGGRWLSERGKDEAGGFLVRSPRSASRIEVDGLSLGHPLNVQGSQATDRMSGSGRRKRAARRVAGNGRRQRQRKRPETGVPWREA